jgi:hypothetical protein
MCTSDAWICIDQTATVVCTAVSEVVVIAAVVPTSPVNNSLLRRVEATTSNTAPSPVFQANNRCSNASHWWRSKARDVDLFMWRTWHVCESLPERSPARITTKIQSAGQLKWWLLVLLPSMTHFSTSEVSTCNVVAIIEYDKSRPTFSNASDVRVSSRILRSNCDSSRSGATQVNGFWWAERS